MTNSASTPSNSDTRPDSVMGGWRDIATAPKDGTEVDLHDGKYRVTDCRWFQYGWEARGDRGWESLEGILEPTHWMHLPAPPTKDQPA